MHRCLLPLVLLALIAAASPLAGQSQVTGIRDLAFGVVIRGVQTTVAPERSDQERAVLRAAPASTGRCSCASPCRPSSPGSGAAAICRSASATTTRSRRAPRRTASRSPSIRTTQTLQPGHQRRLLRQPGRAGLAGGESGHRATTAAPSRSPAPSSDLASARSRGSPAPRSGRRSGRPPRASWWRRMRCTSTIAPAARRSRSTIRAPIPPR